MFLLLVLHLHPHPGSRIAHLGITYYEFFYSQHWGPYPQERVYAWSTETGNSEQPDGSGGVVQAALQGSYSLTSLPWPAALPASLTSLPAELGRVLVVQKTGAQS